MVVPWPTGPVSPRRVLPTARRRAGRGGREGRGGHSHPPDKGGAGRVESMCRRRCGGSGCGAGCPVARAREPGSGVGLRAARRGYRGSGWSNRGAGFRRNAPVCPPPFLHKCKVTPRRPAERGGETAVSSWNSRVAGRDRHRGLHSEVYMDCDVHANPTPGLMGIRLCHRCGRARPASRA